MPARNGEDDRTKARSAESKSLFLPLCLPRKDSGKPHAIGGMRFYSEAGLGTTRVLRSGTKDLAYLMSYYATLRMSVRYGDSDQTILTCHL